MLEIKISELPNKTTTIDPNDLLEVSEWDSGTSTYVSKKYEVNKIVPSGTFLTHNALLNQIGILDPVETPLGLDTMGTITWTRLGLGYYNGYLLGGFPLGKVVMFISPTTSTGFISVNRTDDDNIKIKTTQLTTMTQVDDLLIDTPFKIEVYP
jgi:hypothetical protein